VAEPPFSRSLLFLVAGIALGAVLAAFGILRTNSVRTGTLPPGAVARVNDELIALDEYQRAVNGLVQDRRSGVDSRQRRMVLDRLIEEELLLQRALELGLAREDRRVRRTLTSAVIESVVAGEDGTQPTDDQLRAFYEQDREFFTSPGQVRVRQIWFKATAPDDMPAALDRAQRAVERLRNGEDFAAIKAELGDRDIAPLPDALLPAPKLGDYLGPTAIRTVLTLPAGAISDPVRTSTGYQVFALIERSAAEPPPFEQIKPQILAEMRRRAADEALRRYLDDLRRHAEIVVSDALE
jgi:parvulin-like peptidyl-prolyl isomerase